MIGFRLDAESFRALSERATQQGISVHEQARQCVFEALLRREERVALSPVLVELQGEIAKVRGDVATAIEALLVTFGHVDPQQARDWVTQSFQ